MDRFFVPRIGILAVLGLATLLIGVIVLRSKDTHANLWNAVREGYNRTAVGVVAAEGRTSVAEVGGESAHAALSFYTPMWLMVPQQSEAQGRLRHPGARLYVASGCAKCHGLKGQGGVVGPPLAGLDPKVIAAFARMGPGGMPAFLPPMLSDAELAQIGVYLSSLEPATAPAAATAAPAPAATPSPVAPPPPAGTAAPSPIVSTAPSTLTPAVSTPPPPAAPAPAAGTPPPTPIAAPRGDAVRGKSLYVGRCAACHGENAAGKYGPSLIGMDSENIGKAVRQGKGAMPAFGTSLIKDQELEDMIAYIHSLTATGGGR